MRSFPLSARRRTSSLLAAPIPVPTSTQRSTITPETISTMMAGTPTRASQYPGDHHVQDGSELRGDLGHEPEEGKELAAAGMGGDLGEQAAGQGLAASHYQPHAHSRIGVRPTVRHR